MGSWLYLLFSEVMQFLLQFFSLTLFIYIYLSIFIKKKILLVFS